MELGVFSDLGTGLAFLVLATALGFVFAVAFAVLLLQGRRIPTVATGAAVGVAAAGGALTGTLEGLSWDPSNPEVMRVIALTTAASRMLAFFATAPVAGTFLLAAAVAAARLPPRRPVWAGLALTLTWGTALVVIVGGYATGDTAFAWLRGVAYAGLGTLVAIAWVGGAREGSNAAEVRAAAAVSFPLLVAAGEGARQGLVEIVMIVQGIGSVDPEVRDATVAAFYAYVAKEYPWRWGALGVATAVGVVGLGLSLPGGRRTVGVLSGGVWLAVAAWIYGFGDLGAARMTAVMGLP